MTPQGDICQTLYSNSSAKWSVAQVGSNEEKNVERKSRCAVPGWSSP